MAKEFIRFRCPVCGMMPFVDQVDFEKPYDFMLYRQTIGGSEPTLSIEEKQMPAKDVRKGRGRPPKTPKVRGIIRFDPIESGKEFDLVDTQIKNKIKMLQKIA